MYRKAQLSLDPPNGVRCEAEAPGGVVALRRLDQAQRSLLNQRLEVRATAKDGGWVGLGGFEWVGIEVGVGRVGSGVSP